MFYPRGHANRVDGGNGGNENRKVDEKINEFVTRAQALALYGEPKAEEGRTKAVAIALAAGFAGFMAGRFVPWNEPPRGQPSEIPTPAPTAAPIKVVTQESVRHFEDEKAEPAPRPVAPPVDAAASISVCPPQTARLAGAMDARRIIATQVFGNVVPIRVTLGSNGKETVRVSTEILFDEQGRARHRGSKAYAGGVSTYVSAIVEPELGGIQIALPSSPCVLNFVNKIPPG